MMLRSIARLCIALMLLMCGFASCGCAAGAAQRGLQEMDALTVELMVEQPGNSFALYHVDPNGDLHFAGGLDARQRRFQWSGPLTEAERHQLLRIIDEQQLLEMEPVSSGTPDGLIYELRLESPDAKRSYLVVGENAAIRPIHDLLRQAALHRHDAFMRSLPKPGDRN